MYPPPFIVSSQAGRLHHLDTAGVLWRLCETSSSLHEGLNIPQNVNAVDPQEVRADISEIILHPDFNVRLADQLEDKNS